MKEILDLKCAFFINLMTKCNLDIEYEVVLV